MKFLLSTLLSILSLEGFATLPQVNFTFASRDITEGQQITVTAELSDLTPNGVVIPFNLLGNANSDDHDLTAGTIYISPSHKKGFITFNVYADNETEGTESIIINMLAPANAILGSIKTHTIFIHDAEEDNLPVINFSANASINREGNMMNVEATMSEPSTQIVIVPFVVSGTASFPTDHNLISGSLTFFPGSTTATLSILLNEDGQIEDDETIVINLKAPVVNATLGNETTHVLTIQATYPGVKLEGVNKTQNDVISDLGNRVAKLELLAGSNSVGGFNGSGIGNKAYLGFRYGALLSSFQGITFKSKVPSVSPLNKNVYLNMQVDLNCNPSNPDYAIIVVDFMFTNPGPQNQWNSYSVLSTDQVYRSVGGKGGLPGHISAQTGLLSTVIANFPNACLVNASTGDNGQKKNTDLPALLLVLGDSGTTVASQIYLDDIVVTFASGSNTYNFENTLIVGTINE